MVLPTVRRPDGRVFASVKHSDPSALADQLAETIASSDLPVYVNCDLSDVKLTASCRELGMTPEIVSTRYDVPFAGAMEHIPTLPESAKYRLMMASKVDPEALLKLDNDLRQDVPGTNGWQGTRSSFDEELASSDFDATCYLVAQHTSTGALVGLIRFWRMPDGPRLGLLGVLREHRNGYLGVRLLRAGLDGASEWGSAHFTAHTARPALQNRLVRSGATTTGRFAQMVSHSELA